MRAEITEIMIGKRDYMPLLLMADEQEDMVEKYIDRGRLFVMTDSRHAVMAVCVVTDEDDGLAEIKNIAVDVPYRGLGYGHKMVKFVETICRADGFAMLQVGTGETPSTVAFYRRCGFGISHRVSGFFTANYDHPIVEEGVLLCDMIYLRKQI